MESTERHDQGRLHFAAVMNFWVSRSNLSHSQVAAIAAWGAGEDSLLHTSQVSKLRNAVMATPFLKLFEGLEGMNSAVWTWQLQGPDAAREQFGPLPRVVAPAEMDGAIWLADPRSPARPLGFCGLLEVFVGRLTLPYVASLQVSPSEAQVVSDAIGERLDQWLSQQGGTREGFRRLQAALPDSPAPEMARLRQLVIGSAAYQADEIADLMPWLADVLNLTVEQPLTAAEWLAELRGPDRGRDNRPAEVRRRPAPRRRGR